MPVTQRITANVRDGGGVHINLPMPDSIPVPAIAEAAREYLARKSDHSQAQRIAQASEREVQQAEANDRNKATGVLDALGSAEADIEAMINEDAKVPVGEETVKAKAKLERAKLVSDSTLAALARSRDRLIAVVEANSATWAKAADKEAEKAVMRLVDVAAALERAYADLETHLGVLEMVARGVDDTAGFMIPVMRSVEGEGMARTSLAIEPLKDGIYSLRQRQAQLREVLARG